MRQDVIQKRRVAVQDFLDVFICHPDRKSTRLNSSHSQISYAVFCLKKKTVINSVVVGGDLIRPAVTGPIVAVPSRLMWLWSIALHLSFSRHDPQVHSYFFPLHSNYA